MSRSSDPISFDLAFLQPSLNGFPRMMADLGNVRSCKCLLIHDVCFMCFVCFVFIIQESTRQAFFRGSANDEIFPCHFVQNLATDLFREWKQSPSVSVKHVA